MTSRSDLQEVTFTYEGKRYHVYGRTKSEAREKASAKRALLKAGVKEAQGDQSVAKWSRVWLETYKSGVVNKQWYNAMSGIIENVIVPTIGSIAVKNVKPIDITTVLNSVSDKSESYIKKVMLMLKQIFSAAEENDLILRDPTRRVKLPNYEEQIERRAITDYERELTIKTAEKHPNDGLFFLLMLYCGLRPQEVAVLKRSDFDFENHVLHITRALKSDGTIGKPKSKAGIRDIPTSSTIEQLIPDTDGYICTNAHGERLTKTSIRGLWNRFKRAMEIEHGTKTFRNALIDPFLPDDLTPYCYRHTYCTDLQDAGVPLVVASRFMGHSDVKVTAKIYTHASQDSFNDALEKIERRQGTTQGTTSNTKK